MSGQLSGVYAPVPTPFTETGDLALDRFAANVRHWSETPLAGLVILGSNGEAVHLSRDEKIDLLRAARQAYPANRPIIAGTGQEATRQTIDLTRRAADVGCDLALVSTPSFFIRHNMDGQRRHFEAVADASPLPVLLYNVPRYTGCDLPAEVIVHLAAHPNITGLKDSGGDVAKITDVLRRVPPDFQVLAGSAGFLYPFLAVGAVGGVLALANITPDLCHGIYEAVRTGRHEDAQALQKRAAPLNTAITATFGVPGLKQALDWLGYYGGPPRLPLAPLDEAQQARLQKIMREGGILPDGR